MTGLALYITGGCGAALFDNIWIVLVFRALVGAGVGFIMPLSTGLLSYYYPPKELDRLMALMDVIAFMGGLAFVHIKKMIRENAHFTAPVLFMIGYLILSFSNGVVLSVIGSFFVGFANGAGVPCIIAAASRKAGKEAVSTVMPLISAALYLGQFVSPFVMSAVTTVFGGMGFEHLPFCFAVVLAAILTVIAFFMRKAEK